MVNKKTHKKRNVLRRTVKRRGGVGRYWGYNRPQALPNSNNNEAWGNSNMSPENRRRRRQYYREQARIERRQLGLNENNEYDENNAFEVPETTNNLNSIQIPSNAMNSLMYEPINFNKPILNINNESKHERYYQHNNTIKHLKDKRINPFTKKNISNIKWKMPKKRLN